MSMFMRCFVVAIGEKPSMIEVMVMLRGVE